MITKNSTCTKNEILRNGYIRKNGTKVNGVCIKNRGAPGKGPNVIQLNANHYLSEAGYSDIKNLSEAKRHNALNKVIKKKGHLKVIRSLIARANLNIRQDKEAYEIFKADQEWVSKKYAKISDKLKNKNNKVTKTSAK